MLHLHAIGMDIHHHGAFSIQRPHGSGDWLLVIFKTDALLTLDGRELPAAPGSAVLFKPGQQQMYRSVTGAYINHFLHFSGDEADDLSALPCGRLLALSNLREVEELMQLLCREQVSPSEQKDTCVNLLLQLLLIKLSDGCTSRKPTAHGAHVAQMNMLRADLYANPGKYASVTEMASATGLSLSYFHQLYRERFGVSCYEDLLAARMNAARYYLQHTELTVREIAALCGYENDVVFMRLFKGRLGVTPMGYRGVCKSKANDRD